LSDVALGGAAAVDELEESLVDVDDWTNVTVGVSEAVVVEALVVDVSASPV
jgi:hypothetical protein